MKEQDRRASDFAFMVMQFREEADTWRRDIERDMERGVDAQDLRLRLARAAVQICEESATKALEFLHESGYLLCMACRGTGTETTECKACGGRGCIEKRAR